MNYLSELKKNVVDFLKDEQVKIVLFGSRARKKNQIFSDVDIGLIPSGKLNEKKITLLKEMIENSNIPYKVEFVNFNETGKDFKNEALKEAKIWKP